jgi:hypothetical protein
MGATVCEKGRWKCVFSEIETFDVSEYRSLLLIQVTVLGVKQRAGNYFFSVVVNLICCWTKIYFKSERACSPMVGYPVERYPTIVEALVSHLFFFVLGVSHAVLGKKKEYTYISICIKFLKCPSIKFFLKALAAKSSIQIKICLHHPCNKSFKTRPHIDIFK